MTDGKTRPIKKIKSGKKYNCNYNTYVNFITQHRIQRL